MNSVRDIINSSRDLRVVEANASSQCTAPAESLGPSQWDWSEVRKILVIRLRSIGDTVLATPSLTALKRFVPHAAIDVLVEDWVAPVLVEHPHINDLVTLERQSFAARARVAKEIRSARYDVVYNLHGGTTATFLTRATGARYRVGYQSYQYSHLHTHKAPSPLVLWGQKETHSVEQQLGLLGWTGIPVTDRPRTNLTVTTTAAASIDQSLRDSGLESSKFAVIHPAAAFETKQWAAEKFAQVVEHLADRGFASVAIAAPNETAVLNDLIANSSAKILTLSLSLPEVSALAARAQVFVGNDSGIAHIAAAVGTPSVVIFGSSNVAHWRPWNHAPAEVVLEEMDCQPCHGYFCEKFEQPECILRVPVSRVNAAIDRLLQDPLSRS